MKNAVLLFAVAAMLVFAGCTGAPAQKTEQPTATQAPTVAPTTALVAKLSGAVKVDGSSTVFPITEAVGEEFQKLHKDVKVTVGISGTGGGFKKFCNGEIDISDASRPIKKSEVDACAAKGIEFIEIPVAFDGLSIMVNPANNWIGEGMTVAELKKIWHPNSTVMKWSDFRQGWPNEKIYLVGAGQDSGTFDYFTEAINGKERLSRADYLASEDDNVLVQAIANEKYALGYFGYAYYIENKNKLKLVAINDENDANGKGYVLPSDEAIRTGTYQPLSRPLFIYVNKKSAERKEIQEFIKYYLTNGKPLVKQVGYIQIPDKAYELGLKRFENRKTGSIFAGGSQVGVSIEDILAKE